MIPTFGNLEGVTLDSGCSSIIAPRAPVPMVFDSPP